MTQNILFGKDNCPQCVTLSNYLDELGITYDYVDVVHNMELFQQYVPGARSVPHFVYNNTLIGDTKQVIKAVGNGIING